MQLIILGMHRSGTSVLARMLNLMGAYFGPEGMSTGALPENPKGFWERRDVRALNDAVLHSIGCDWNRVHAFDPARVPDGVVAKFDAEASKLVLELDAHRPWMLKEPRLCLLFPLWRRLFEVPFCIHILRHPVEVASSLHRRNGMPIPVGLALWEKYARAALSASSDLPGIMVAHAELRSSPVATVARIHRQLEDAGIGGLRMPAAREIETFVDPGLHREDKDRSDLQAFADAPQIALYERMLAWSPGDDWDATLPPEADALLAGYEAGLPGFTATGDLVLPASYTSAARQRGEIAGLREQLAAAREQVERNAGEIYRLTRQAMEREDALTGQAGHAKDALEDARRRLAEAGGELEHSQAQLQDARTKLAELMQKQAGLEQASATLRERLREQTRATGSAETRVRELEVRLQQLGARLAGREQQAAAMASSLGWKLTAPLRALGRRLRGGGAGQDAEHDQAGQLRASGLFDADWYLGTYPDVAASGEDPALHYLRHGAGEGRDPSPAFSTRAYTARHPELAVTAENPLLHHLEFRRLMEAAHPGTDAARSTSAPR